MSGIVPTLGRIVWFRLAGYQADEINRRRADALRWRPSDAAHSLDQHRGAGDGSQIHVGNEVKAGQIVPAMIVAVWGDKPESAVNLKCFLDGSDDYWVRSTAVGAPDHDGKYHWMPYQVGQAAKHAEATPPGMMRNAAGALHPIPETLGKPV